MAYRIDAVGRSVSPTPTYTYMEMTVPGAAWIVASDSTAGEGEQIVDEVRALVDSAAR